MRAPVNKSGLFLCHYTIRTFSCVHGPPSMKTRAPASHDSSDDFRSRIRTIRGQKVILDVDLASIYGVTTKRLNEQVKRNKRRFPGDFIFLLTWAEADAALESRSQIATLKRGSNVKYRPYAFTENGAVMAANVLNSPQAVRMSVFVVRAFIQMRELLSGSRELAAELRKLEAKLTSRLDDHETMIIDVLRRIMDMIDPPPLPPTPEKSLGFHTTLKRAPR